MDHLDHSLPATPSQTGMPLSDQALDQLFRQARTYNHFADKPVPVPLLQALYDLTKWGPTSANCQPMRLIFVTSKAAKEKLLPCLAEANKAKATSAPVIAILANDHRFHENLPEQFPHTDAKSWFTGNQALIDETAMRNGTLQGAYLMLAARALGLDCGPMSGFDAALVDKAFWDDSDIKTNFLCNIGYGTEQGLFARSPRLQFDTACRIV